MQHVGVRLELGDGGDVRDGEAVQARPLGQQLGGVRAGALLGVGRGGLGIGIGHVRSLDSSLRGQKYTHMELGSFGRPRRAPHLNLGTVPTLW